MEVVDSVVHHNGFAEAAIKVGWLDLDNGTATLPNYDRHNTSSAKARIQAAQRKRRQRAKERAENVTQMSQ